MDQICSQKQKKTNTEHYDIHAILRCNDENTLLFLYILSLKVVVGVFGYFRP